MYWKSGHSRVGACGDAKLSLVNFAERVQDAGDLLPALPVAKKSRVPRHPERTTHPGSLQLDSNGGKQNKVPRRPERTTHPGSLQLDSNGGK